MYYVYESRSRANHVFGAKEIKTYLFGHIFQNFFLPCLSRTYLAMHGNILALG